MIKSFFGMVKTRLFRLFRFFSSVNGSQESVDRAAFSKNIRKKEFSCSLLLRYCKTEEADLLSSHKGVININYTT